MHRFRELGFPTGFCEVLDYGLPLLMKTTPPSSKRNNHESASADENRTFTSQTLDKWEAMEVFRRVRKRPHTINPLAVISKDGKKRLVLDATSSGLNDCLMSPKFPLPDMESIVRTLYDGSFMMKSDLASGFLQLPINADEQTYLGFTHPIEGTYCVMQRLPFGLASAPFLFMTFTKTIERAVEKILGVQTRVYIDDWFFAGRDAAKLQDEFTSFVRLLDYLGVKLQHSKTEGPTRDISYLGLGIHTERHLIYLPEDKRIKYLKGLTDLLQDERSTMASLAKTAGQLVHISAIHKAGAGHIQPLWNIIYKDRTQWTRNQLARETLTLDDDLTACLKWWKQVLQSTQITRKIWVADDRRLFIWGSYTAAIDTYQAITICTDASDLGWGASTGISTVSGLWTPAQQENSINWRELKSVLLAIRQWGFLRNAPLLVLTDNVTTVAAIRLRASRAPPLQGLVDELTYLEDSRGIETIAIHIPGKLNDLPDRLSRGLPTMTASMLTFDPLLLPPELRDAHQLVGITWKHRKFDAQPFARSQPIQHTSTRTLLIAITSPDLPFLQLHVRALRSRTAETWFLIPYIPTAHLPIEHTKLCQELTEGVCIDAPNASWMLLKVMPNP